MLRRISVLLLIGAVIIVGGVACEEKRVGAGPKNGRESAPSAPVDIGPSLYPPAQWPTYVLSTSTVDAAPIPGHLTVIDKVDLPAQRDGKIKIIGREIRAGEKVNPNEVYVHPVTKVQYRALYPGDAVKKGDMVVLLDDQEAAADFAIQSAAVEAAIADAESAKYTTEYYKIQMEKTVDLYKKGGTTDQEVRKSEAEFQRSRADKASKEAGKTKADGEKEKAGVLLEMFHIRSTMDGILQPHNRNPGEGIRANDTALQIHNLDQLRVEGLVDKGVRDQLSVGTRVRIEPNRESTPSRKLYGHILPITAVAISNHPSDPLIVTASEDRTARVWRRTQVGQVAELRHPSVAVRAVACTGPTCSSHLCLTGADDGKARLWDLDTTSVNPQPLRELEGFQHKGIISSVAFSPDGKFCATADSRDICLWDVETGQFKYQFPQLHRGAITTLAFTPEAKLVSAARDNTIKVWTLGTSGATLEFSQEGRSGDVGQVGVSHDGGKVLLDVAQSLRVLTLQDRRIEGVMQPISDSAKFSTFAQFSPDDSLVLTGLNTEGRLGVWLAPGPKVRPAEVRRFNPQDRMAMFTCGAVSPYKQHPFAATGTQDGTLYIWPMPTDSEVLAERIEGEITFVDQETDAGAQQIRVWAKFDNRQAKLLAGGSVTMVAVPSEK
jgi:WD40 repeat protein